MPSLNEQIIKICPWPLYCQHPKLSPSNNMGFWSIIRFWRKYWCLQFLEQYKLTEVWLCKTWNQIRNCYNSSQRKVPHLKSRLFKKINWAWNKSRVPQNSALPPSNPPCAIHQACVVGFLSLFFVLALQVECGLAETTHGIMSFKFPILFSQFWSKK